MSGPSRRTLKRLFALSGNRCAYPACSHLIVQDGVSVGEVCHINAARPGGCRFDSSQTDAERHGFSNLMLLCPTHHTLIDAEPEQYTSEMLREMKAVHEEWASRAGEAGQERAATLLLESLKRVNASHSVGNFAVANTGSVVQIINMPATKRKIVLAPPVGALGADLDVSRYVKYLIDRFNEFAEADKTRKTPFRHAAIYAIIKREFGSNWNMVPLQKSDALILFLQARIDKTLIGRVQKKAGRRTFSSFDDFLAKGGA